MFKRKNGFTLIEVIVSIALLGIISIGFLGALTNNLNFLKINKSMTASAFLDQKDMELEILQTKADIKDGTITAGSMTTLNNVFESGVSVKAYQLKFPYNKQDIYTLVTDTRLPEFKVPIAQNVVAQLRTGTNPVSFAYAVADTNVLGSSSIDPSTTDVFMVNNYTWYASRPGFNIPMPNTPIPEIEIGNKYPKFPEDYSLIPTSTSLNLNDVRDYAGRHIVFAVTPAAKSGRMGQTVPSKPVYISGLPAVASDLVLHLDASTISNTDTSQVTASGSDLLVEKWNDLTANKKNAKKTTASARPKLKEHPVGGDFVGKYVDFDSDKNLLVEHNATRNTTLYTFAVVRGDVSSVFYNSNSKTNINGVNSQTIDVTGLWKIVYFEYTSPDHDNSNKITLGNSNVDVAELIVYKGTFTEANKNAVIEYLKEKYIPLDVVGNIIQLRPMTDVEIIKDTPYNLPYAVLAEMEHGSDRFVPVDWVPNTVNTSSIGTHTFTATATNDNTKTTTLKVIVKDFVHVSSISLNKTILNLLINDTESLKPTILPIDATNKAITWESSDPSVVAITDYDHTNANIKALKAGTANITVTTVDENKKATCLVTVTGNTSDIKIDRAKFLVNINESNESSNRAIITFNNEIKLKTLNDFKLNSTLIGGSTISSISLSNADPKSIIVTFTNNIANTTYTTSSSGNRINNAAILNKDGGQVNITNGQNFDISGEILTYNTNSIPYRITTFFGAKAIDVEGSSGDSSDKIIIYDNKNNSEANQLWYLNVDSNDFTHRISWNKSSTRYYLYENGADNNIIQKTNVNDTSAKWIIERFRKSNNQINYYTIKPLNYDNRYLASPNITNVTKIKLLDGMGYSFYQWQITKQAEDARQSPVKEWNFGSNAESWGNTNNISDFKRISDGGLGVITGGITGIDPFVHSPAGLDVNTNNASKIVIRLKNSSASNTGQIYFSTTSSGNWSEVRRINFPIIPNSGYTEYVIDFGYLGSWTGTLHRFRIDPTTTVTSGSFSIDYVKIYK
jgi:prepilin-type N-terminal cleavage/methylation domain-containing protein